MQEPVQHRRGDRRVPERRGPISNADVGAQDRRRLQIPSGRRRTAPPSPPTRRSLAGPRLSRIHGFARLSWTGSPSTQP
jgi:hypothetical protein